MKAGSFIAQVPIPISSEHTERKLLSLLNSDEKLRQKSCVFEIGWPPSLIAVHRSYINSYIFYVILKAHHHLLELQIHASRKGNLLKQKD